MQPGPNSRHKRGVYGTKGQFHSNNIPSGRYRAVSWSIMDTNRVFIFGGYGVDVNGEVGSLADLWEYRIKTNQWKWASGG